MREQVQAQLREQAAVHTAAEAVRTVAGAVRTAAGAVSLRPKPEISTTAMSAAKPLKSAVISLRKPWNTASVRIITASPIATVMVAMRVITTPRSPPWERAVRRASSNSIFFILITLLLCHLIHNAGLLLGTKV